MPVLISKYIESRPAINACIYQDGKLLETVRAMIDTGATKTFLSHDFCLEHGMKSASKSKTTTPYDEELETSIYNNVKIQLLGDNEKTKEIILEEVEAIVGSVYDFPVIIGMDIICKGLFILSCKDKEFTLDFAK